VVFRTDEVMVLEDPGQPVSDTGIRTVIFAPIPPLLGVIFAWRQEARCERDGRATRRARQTSTRY
jgi:hypothetical protein